MDFLACRSRNVHFLHIRLSIMWYLCTQKIRNGHRSSSDKPYFLSTKRFAILQPKTGNKEISR